MIQTLIARNFSGVTRLVTLAFCAINALHPDGIVIKKPIGLFIKEAPLYGDP